MKQQAVKYKNQIWCEVWKDSDFDVIDLDIQIADFEALIHTQANMLTDVKAENRQQAEKIADWKKDWEIAEAKSLDLRTENQRLKEGNDEALRLSIKTIMNAVVEAIGVDGHQWSDRPCQTCQVVTSIIGQPFGCY